MLLKSFGIILLPFFFAHLWAVLGHYICFQLGLQFGLHGFLGLQHAVLPSHIFGPCELVHVTRLFWAHTPESCFEAHAVKPFFSPLALYNGRFIQSLFFTILLFILLPCQGYNPCAIFLNTIATSLVRSCFCWRYA